MRFKSQLPRILFRRWPIQIVDDIKMVHHLNQMESYIWRAHAHMPASVAFLTVSCSGRLLQVQAGLCH